MKKILLIALAIALVLSLCAGCNNNRRIIIDDDDFDDEPIVIDTSNTSDDNSNVDDDKPNSDSPDGWPAVLPPYPDGEIESIVPGQNDSLTITIINTSKAAMEEYAATMNDAGWKSAGSDDLGFIAGMEFQKGDKGVSIMFVEEEASVYIKLRNILEEGVLPNVWPADQLPLGFPEYPDGYIVSVEVIAGGMLCIEIMESGKGNFDKFVAALKDIGWKFEGDGAETYEFDGEEYGVEFWLIEKDRYYGDISFSDPIGMVSISISSYD